MCNKLLLNNQRFYYFAAAENSQDYRMKKIIASLIVLFLLIGCNETAKITGPDANKEIKVLFIGNSITFYNDMPLIFKKICENKGKKVIVDQLVQGGATLKFFETYIGTPQTINSEKWDYVILQDGDWRVIYPEEHNLLLPAVEKLKTMIYMNQNTTKIFYQMLHSDKDGVTMRGIPYSYDQMQDKLRAGAVKFGIISDLEIAPVGWGWKILKDKNTTIDLYLEDGLHPSYSGSYLNACVFFSLIYKESSLHNYSDKQLSQTNAELLQKAADDAVFNIQSWKY